MVLLQITDLKSSIVEIGIKNYKVQTYAKIYFSTI